MGHIDAAPSSPPRHVAILLRAHGRFTNNIPDYEIMSDSHDHSCPMLNHSPVSKAYIFR